MCILTIKQDENLLPHCAKSCISVLGKNHKDCLWSKSKRFAPVLWSESLVSLSLWSLRNDACFVKMTSNMPFAKVFFLLMRSRLSIPLRVTLTLIPKSIGSFCGCFMACGEALNIGMIKSMPFFALLVSLILLKIRVSILASLLTLQIILAQNWSLASHLVSMSMMSSTF